MSFGTEKLRMIYGSQVYGTNLPTSDTDFKGIFLPNARDILLQSARRNYGFSTKLDPSARNTASDVDVELFSLQEYLRLLLDGQTIALDMLFVPKTYYVNYETWDSWEEILLNKKEFLHSGVSSFAGYCRTQASKYGIKGSRISAVRKTLEWAKSFPKSARLNSHFNEVGLFVSQVSIEGHEALLNRESLILLNEIKTKSGSELHLEVCGRKFPLTVTFGYITEKLERIYSEYGHRARMAERQEGIDWKALMHAVRVCKEALELLRSHNISFPRPERELLLQIRKGEVPYQKVAELIELGLIELEAAKKESTLPDKPNYSLAEEILVNAHKAEIKKLF